MHACRLLGWNCMPCDRSSTMNMENGVRCCIVRVYVVEHGDDGRRTELNWYVASCGHSECLPGTRWCRPINSATGRRAHGPGQPALAATGAAQDIDACMNRPAGWADPY